jgi:hypoxanthine phosphoribosyltransferase
MGVIVEPATQVQTLFSATQIAERVAEMGRQISRDYAGERLVLLGVLKGAAVFLGDLVRAIDLDVTYDFVAISSYGADTKSSGVVRILKDVDRTMDGEHVLIVEDIVDTGLTLAYLVRLFESRSPKSLRVCTFLDKPARRVQEVRIDYCGFEIPDRFVVGCGLDVNEKYRSLPFVGTL